MGAARAIGSTAITAFLAFSGCGDPSSQLDSPPSSDAGQPPDTVTPDAGMPGDAQPEPDADADDGCPSLFSQDELPEWHVTLSDQEWAALEDEFYNRLAREAAGLDRNPYHPVEDITYDDGSGPVHVPGVLIRLKGQSSWVHAVLYDENPKMQFVIAFNEVDSDKRFKGVRKVELDMPRTDWTYLRHRLALHTMRKVGQDAQCANNAMLYINGEYYGLFTHVERIDKEFLQRIYGKVNGADDGDLWKSGSRIETNEDNYSEDRIDALWSATSSVELGALADLDDAVHEWAAEAILPHADGYHIGRHNYFLYDHPHRGFLWLPSDLDTAFDFYPHDLDVAFPQCVARDYRHWGPYATVLGDPAWMAEYIAAITEARQFYDPDEQVALVEEWTNQIASAALADPRRPFTIDDHTWALGQLREHLYLRDDFIGDWLTCRQNGTGQDWDQDGTVFCFDCDDKNSAVHPAQTETCNGVDDDCDGFVDEGLQCP
ncbi:MAG TPA: CotH kinase family protein [Kofleriaceae bacterium]|nr:CotH kinase family protein [Kofleriaceae bacterium]